MISIEIKARAEFSVLTVMNPIKVKIGACGRNNFKTLQQGKEGMKGRTGKRHIVIKMPPYDTPPIHLHGHPISQHPLS